MWRRLEIQATEKLVNSLNSKQKRLEIRPNSNWIRLTKLHNLRKAMVTMRLFTEEYVSWRCANDESQMPLPEHIILSPCDACGTGFGTLQDMLKNGKLKVNTIKEVKRLAWITYRPALIQRDSTQHGNSDQNTSSQRTSKRQKPSNLITIQTTTDQNVSPVQV